MPTVQYQFDILIYRWYGAIDVWTQGNAGRASVLIDTTRFVNPKYYFEVVVKTQNAATEVQARLLDCNTSDVVNGGVEVAGSVLTSTSTSFVRLRSGQLALVSGHRFRAQVRGSNALNNIYIDAARIIVEDDVSAGWSLGEEQVEVFVAVDYTPPAGDTWHTPTDIPIYKYEAGTRDGSVTTYFEACLACLTAGRTVRARLIEHSNPDLSDTGTVVTGSQVNVTPASADIPVRARSGAITLTDGKYYAAQITCASGNKTVRLTSARHVIQQSGAITKAQLIKRTGRRLGDVTSTSFQRTESQAYLEKAKLPAYATFLYCATLRIANAATYAYSDLYNVTDAGSVSGSLLQTNSTIRVWKRSSSLASVPDLKDYDSRVRTGSGSYAATIDAGYLVINVSSAPPLAPLPATLTLLGVG